MDAYLDYLGLYRSDVAKDETCLFRAVSEQLFRTQVYHEELKESVIAFIRRNKWLFKEDTEDLEEHLQNLESSTVWAGPLEMKALSLKYNIEFTVYSEIGEPPLKITNINSTGKNIVLAGFGDNRYDSVYTKEHLVASALCQSITYKILYEGVFNYENVDEAVEKMLHDKNYSKQRKNLSQYLKRELKEDEQDTSPTEEHSPQDMKKLLQQGIPPFPYKVAKALDKNIYRNVPFDIWNEKKKENLKNEKYVTPALKPGVKCKVLLDHDGAKLKCTGYVQEMSDDDDDVLVYVEELCEKCALKRSNIEIVPIPLYKAQTWQGGKTYRVNNDVSNYEPERNNSFFDRKVKKKSRKNHQDSGHHSNNEYKESRKFGGDGNNHTRYRTHNHDNHYPSHNQNDDNGPYRSYSNNRKTRHGSFLLDETPKSKKNEDSSPGILPPVPAETYRETHRETHTSQTTYQVTSEYTSEIMIQTPTQEFAMPDVFFSPPPAMNSFDSASYSPTTEFLNWDFPPPPPGFTSSNPLQIPQPNLAHHQPEEIVMPPTPNGTPTMALYPVPPYYIYSERPPAASVQYLPFYDGNSGFTSILNTPPNSGATPPSVFPWFPNYNNIQTSPLPQYSSPVQTGYWGCTPPEMTAFNNAILTPQWGPQGSYMMPAPAVPYAYPQASMMPAQEQLPI